MRKKYNFTNLIYQSQRFSRKFNVSWREAHYNYNYNVLCKNAPWVTSPVLSSPAGGTANSSMLYVLLSVLLGERPHRIVELGVGQSTLLLSQYKSWNKGAFVTSVDHDRYWLNVVEKTVGNNVELVHAPLVKKSINGLNVSWYGIGDDAVSDVDLLIVDGPPAYLNECRYNRYGIIDYIPDIMANEFMIIIDDASRKGERRLVKDLVKKLPEDVKVGSIYGMSSQILLATERYSRFLFL